MRQVNPYLITGPALISFSGGRTSAFMLHEILRAYDGKLPDDVIVAFANTGKEREETLRFVHECESRWNVPVHWLEWTDTNIGFQRVGFNSASRSGEPFAGVIRKYGIVPNGVSRFCTAKLKVHTMTKFMRSLGYDRWVNAVGLRYDEGHRVLKQLARNDAGKERYTAVMPLSKAKVAVRDIKAFWDAQEFDLQLQSHEGNCDLCFLKSRSKLKELIRANPGMVDWWKRQEDLASVSAQGRGGQFNRDRTFADIEQEVLTQPFMPGMTGDDEEYDVECGLHCGAEAA
ncbi:phosphoadenosine phosphosulfate reductase family protein [Mesorhizobium sp. M0028]|uniref:phosphoadenosine phosphosulfate reductase domain-containing protein n=1 Tax=Mesorhizobium sp. M0028 TaxID=2956849 RepID=UPI00333B1054